MFGNSKFDKLLSGTEYRANFTSGLRAPVSRRRGGADEGRRLSQGETEGADLRGNLPGVDQQLCRIPYTPRIRSGMWWVRDLLHRLVFTCLVR